MHRSSKALAAGMFAALLGITASARADTPHAKVTQLMTRALADYPGQEMEMIVVDYPPGSVDPVHRHDANAMLYVLEGSIVMQVQGGKAVTLKPGDAFYEGPNDIHTVGRNASQTAPARFVVVFLKKQGAPILTPVQQPAQ